MEGKLSRDKCVQPYTEYEDYKIIPWYKGIEISEKDNIFYGLGMEHPFSYPERDRDSDENNESIPSDELFNLFNSDPNIEKIKGLSIGAIHPSDFITEVLSDEKYESNDNNHYFDPDDMLYENEESIFNEFCKKIMSLKPRLKKLTRLIIGNYYIDDYRHIIFKFELLMELLNNFPQFDFLLVRGDIEIPDQIIEHKGLKTLIFEGIGFSDENLKRLFKWKLPNLKELVIFLGTEHWRWERRRAGYDYDQMDQSIMTPIFSGKIFPTLTSLGLVDSDCTDELAYELAASNIIKRLEKINLSKGTLTDEGAEILINSPEIEHVKLLNLNENYCSPRMIEYMKKRIADFKKRDIQIELLIADNKDTRSMQDRFQTVRE